MRGVVIGVSAERSIGFACARALRELGAEVVVTSRREREGATASLAASIGAVAIPLDADEPRSITAAFAWLERSFGHLDFVVHTLMRVPPALLEQPLTAVDRDSFARVLGVGVHSLIAVCKQARPLLVRSEAPRVVAISSPSAHRMTPHYHVAGIAKAALEAALLYLAQELGPDGVLCNAVSPGLIDTDGAVAVVGPEVAGATRAHMARRAATRRATSLEDVAECVAWLCSPRLRNVTGEVITIDGGYARGYLSMR